MDIIVVGNGVAGITCAMTARQRDPKASITVVSGETDYFFSRTALMYAYLDRMGRRELEPFERKTWEAQRINLVRDWVVDLDHAARTVKLAGGKTQHFDRLVLAVGARARKPAWAGLETVKDGVVNFVSMQDLDACERLTPSTKRAVVVGGGLIGIELVECLRHFGVAVTFLIREPYYWPMALGAAEAAMVQAHLLKHGVDVRTADEVKQVHADAQGRVSGITTSKGERLDAQMLGVAIGVEPNVERLRAFKDVPALGRGIQVNDRFETSLADVFAVGDCAEIALADKPLIELIWYSAKRHGAHVAGNLFGGNLAYRPPTFFNSSKFFDIEFTTVGQVQDAGDGVQSIYGRVAGKDISQRLVHNTKGVLGFNMLGSRWNHEVLCRWVEERRSARFCLEHLAQAQFDHEFGRAALAISPAMLDGPAVHA